MYKELFHSIRDSSIDIIFDVGANKGDVTLGLSNEYPDSNIFVFEPSPQTFKKLTSNLSNVPNVTLINTAIGKKEGFARMTQGADLMNKIVSDETEDTVIVPITTIDALVSSYNLDKIDFLKIDTEGFELEVLLGAGHSLSKLSINVIEVEVGLNPENQHHVPFEKIKWHLENYGYRLYRIFEPVHEWPAGSPHLRRCNAIFISSLVISLNTRQ